MAKSSKVLTKRQLVSQYNKAVVLNRLYWSEGGISRTQLYQETNIRPTTLTKLTDELLSENLIKNCGYSQSTGGRRRELLSINRQAGYILGIDIGAAKIVGVMSDLKGGVLREIIGPTSDQGRDAVLSQVENIVTGLKKDSKKILGLGIATVGLLDTSRGILRLATNIKGWKDVPLKRWAEERFDLPIFVDGSAKAMALSERWYGSARNVDDFVFVNVGIGVGCGIITGGRIHRGVTETAGELGHIFIKEDTPVCRCGSKGCLEALISGPAIARTAQKLLQQGMPSSVRDETENLDELTAEDVADAAKKGDKLALEIFQKTGRYLGYGLTALINILNPKLIIIGGGVAKAGDLLLEPVKETVERCALQIPGDAVQIRLSSFSDLAGALGATTLVLDELLAIPQLPTIS